VIVVPKQPVPVFPLPDVVLFPRTVIPLHVFELRYRTMVREALSGERLIAMALLQPGWERDYEGSPAFHALGCLGRFEEVEWLPNDCYDLRLLGLARVRFGQTVREFPYRATRVTLLPQEPFSEDDPLIQIEKRALIETCARWASAEAEPDELRPDPTFGEGLGYEALVNAACMGVPATPADRLGLLAMDSVVRRGHRVRELIERRLRRRPATPRPPEGGERN
jgi:Lon protease-like protein